MITICDNPPRSYLAFTFRAFVHDDVAESRRLAVGRRFSVLGRRRSVETGLAAAAATDRRPLRMWRRPQVHATTRRRHTYLGQLHLATELTRPLLITTATHAPTLKRTNPQTTPPTTTTSVWPVQAPVAELNRSYAAYQVDTVRFPLWSRADDAEASGGWKLWSTSRLRKRGFAHYPVIRTLPLEVV